MDSTIHSRGPVPKTIPICLWSTTDFFEKLITNFRNWTFVQTSWMPCAGTICLVVLAIGARSVVMRLHLEAMTTTSDSVLAGNVMSIATQIIERSFCSSIRGTCDNILVTSASAPVLCIANFARRSGAIFHSMGVTFEGIY